MRRNIFSLLVFIVCTVNGVSGSLIPDVATIEALITLHKECKNQETAANVRIASSFGEQSSMTEYANKIRNKKAVFDSKVSDITAWITLASRLGFTGNSLYRLIDQYNDFLSVSYNKAKDDPLAGLYFSDANYAMVREVKQLVKIFAKMTAGGAVMRSNMKERVMMLSMIDAGITQCRGILSKANLKINILGAPNIKTYYLWEVLNSDTFNKIASDVIKNWN